MPDDLYSELYLFFFSHQANLIRSQHLLPFECTHDDDEKHNYNNKLYHELMMNNQYITRMYLRLWMYEEFATKGK